MRDLLAAFQPNQARLHRLQFPNAHLSLQVACAVVSLPFTRVHANSKPGKFHFKPAQEKNGIGFGCGLILLRL
jgi:hypothetical protein